MALGGLSAVTGGFEAVQGAMALAGSENQNLQKAMLKVQGAMALANGVQQVQIALQKESAFMKGVDAVKTTALSVATGVYTAVVGTSTGAMKLLKIAMISSGVGALVVGIGLLVANFEMLMTPISGAIQLLKDFGDWIGLTSFAEDEANSKSKAIAEAKTKALDDQIVAFDKANAKKLKNCRSKNKSVRRPNYCI